MYDIRNLNIWKESGSNIFKSRDKILEDDALERKERIMSDKCQIVFNEIMKLVPTADFAAIKNRRGGKLRFPMYINNALMEADLEVLELSVRSSNCLHRAGYRTVGELVEAIESSEDLKKIRNCGTKSIDEIMEQLFCYQYSLIPASGKERFINRVLQLNAS
ncbi:MAG: hypothetical protein IJ353_07025 [Lachnospiraceae bacterium]|nr:hypothetical protein [Lachnospiraceae bacterium]